MWICLRFLFTITIFVLCALSLSSVQAAEARKKQILILNSYHDGYKWTDDIMAGINSVFPSGGPEYIVRVEYMDTKRVSSGDYIKHLLAIYRAKYVGSSFDLILTSDDAAYTFILKNGKELSPGTPVVFCGVNSFGPELLAGRTGITGVVEGYDIQRTITTAVRLHPGVKTVYYINDKTVTGQAIQKEFEKTIKEFRGSLNFRELKGRNLEEIETLVQRLPGDSIILMLIYFRDAEGKSYSYSEAIKRLASKSNLPIYGVWDFHLGHGIVGGRLTNGFHQGRTAAEMGLRILQGESADAIDVITENTTQFAFDDLKLKQYNISLDQLPRDSAIINYSGNSKKQLLVLNSYHKGMQWEDDIDLGLRESLQDHMTDLEISYDFMDVKRNSDPTFIHSSHKSLAAKYANRKFDAILAVDDAAFHFLTLYRDSVFPATPVVFCGLNYYEDSFKNRDWTSWFTGVVESYDLKGTLEVALKIQPQAKKVIIINDTTLTGKANRRNIDTLMAAYQDQLVFELWEEINMPDIQSRVRELGMDTIVLLLSFYRDGSNNSYSYSDTIRLISSESTVPLYSVWDFYLGKGILGGLLVSGVNQGQTAGEMIAQIFHGTPVDMVPLVTESPNEYMFDRKVLDRYKLSPLQLPLGSTIINLPFSFTKFYKENRRVVNVFLILSLFIVVLILLILLQNNTIRVRKQFEKELEKARNVAEQANIAKGRFLANMSHEIRTPMNGLIGMTDLAMETSLDSTQRGYLEIVKSSAQSLLRVINDILDYSKIEAGKLELTEEPFDLHKLLTDITTLFGVSSGQKGLDLKLDSSADVPQMVVGDSIRLRQVLCNLVGNAIKFTEAGTVTLEVTCPQPEEKKHMIHFKVKDTGTGIASELQSKLFDDFTQLESLSVKQGVGTGLGLSISKQLVVLMQGVITLKSTPGIGSTFTFEIPMARSFDIVIEDTVPTYSALKLDRQANILVAEDDEVSRSLMRMLLEKQGCKVVTVATGTAVLELLEKTSFDLVVMDINMPEMSGLEATAAIRLREPEGVRIPIVAISANAMKYDKEKGYAAGMDDYLTKPIQMDKVYTTLSKWLQV